MRDRGSRRSVQQNECSQREYSYLKKGNSLLTDESSPLGVVAWRGLRSRVVSEGMDVISNSGLHSDRSLFEFSAQFVFITEEPCSHR
jgi:hypothetical protein